MQAREKAVEDVAAEPPAPAKRPPPPVNGAAAGEKPKFTFAEEEIAQAKKEVTSPIRREYTPVFQPPRSGSSPAMQPPIMPPRPPLGGERAAPGMGDSRFRPAGAAYQSQFSSPAQQGYRPLDPPGFKRPLGPPAPRGYPSSGPAGFRDRPGADPRLAAQREAYEAYRRGELHPPELGDDEPLLDDPARRPRPLPPRAKQPAFEEDLSEVFEDQAPPPPLPRRRASAQDYNQAYREFEEGLAQPDKRRSSGPWLLLALLLVAAVVTGAGVYYYYEIKKSAGVAQNNTATEQVPVVQPPEEPAKVEPVQEAADPPVEPVMPVQAQKKKQIYDRIVGEQEVQGNIVPTVEQPVQLDSQGAPAATGTVPAAEPIPLPSEVVPAGGQPAGGTQGNSTDPLPLPLPPPPGDSGSLDPPAPSQGLLPTQTAKQTVAAAPAGISGAETAQPIPNGSPIAAKPLSTTAGAASDTQATPPSAAAPATSDTSIDDADAADEPPAVPQKKAAEKQAAQKKTAAKKDSDSKLGAEPVVLVPPATATPPAAAGTVEQPALAASEQPADQSESKSGSFFNFGSSSGESAFKRLKGKSASDAVDRRPAANNGDTTQVAAVDPQTSGAPQGEPATQSVPETAPAAAGEAGYVAQLASYRSEAEALAEFDRLRARHPDILGGMSSRVTKGSAAGITRYRLGVGPLSDKAAADSICNRLLAAGERDCLAKRL
jgi:hypothetical protein